MVRLALYQPDRPHNLGAAMRLCACMGVALDIVEPCGFPFDDRRIRQSALDYGRWVGLTRHLSFDRFRSFVSDPPRRLVLLSTQAAEPYHRFGFCDRDVLLLGRESAGVPDFVHGLADARLKIPMSVGPRSLNVAAAGSLVLGEALRQLGHLDMLEATGHKVGARSG